MLRNSFIVFVCGWITWFMMDKPGAVQFSFPERSGDLIGNFQFAFDMLTAGYQDLAFIFIWQHHYIVLSLLCGAMLAVVTGIVGDYLGRRSMRKLVLPNAIGLKDVSGRIEKPGSESTPVESRELVGDQRIE